MCGLTAVFARNKGFFLDDLIQMTDLVAHRGPNDSGFIFKDLKGHFFQCNSNNQQEFSKNLLINFGFGFRRLSILDLSQSGHQPMSYKNGRYWIVFNGEIYNYLEIKNELIKFGYNFKSNTDTEVILAAYDYYGTNCFNLFNGMWAFIIYDSKNNEVIISRDRFGIKPLYYYIDKNYLIFVSEIKQLMAVNELDIEPNVQKIKEDLLVDTREYTSETSFTNVFRFPNSHFLKLSLNDEKFYLKFERYYNLKFNDNLDYNFDKKMAERYSEEYYDILSSAVDLRLRADVDVGTCLSGGLDSSSIAYLVNQKLKEKNKIENQKTFSLVYNDPQYKYCDESTFIDKLAQTLKLNSFKIYPSVNDVIKNYELMIYAMDTPQHSTLMSYIFTYKLVKNHGVTVTLDGQGADELQAGYIPYFRYYFSNMKINQIPEHISGNVNKMEGSTKEILTGILFSVFNNSYAKEIIEKILIEKKYQNPFKNLNEQLFLDFNNNLQTLLHYGDRGSMINSIEARFPMLDYRNVEFWMNLPLSYKIHDGWTKYIARLAFNKKLPDEIVWRKDKKGWELPQKEWIKNGLGEKIIFEIENSSFLKELGIKFDRKYLIRDVKNHKYWKLPIKLYNLSLWYKIFFIEGVKKYAKICDNISS